MKLLKGQTQTVEQDGIKLELKVMDTVMQSTIATLGAQALSGIDASVRMSGYILRNCVDKISVDGVSYDPIELTTKADISDQKTRRTLIAMNNMVLNAAFPTQDEEKK